MAMSGPGQELRATAPNFCRVALQVTRDIPFPQRFSSWRARIIARDLQIPAVSAKTPCGATLDTRVTTGWLTRWVASSAACAWVQDWAYATGARQLADARHAASVVASVLTWPAVRSNDPRPSAAPAGDAAGGTRTSSPFGWLLAYQHAVRGGNRGAVERLLAGVDGFGDCQNFDLDLIAYTQRHLVGSSVTSAQGANLLLAHLRSEGV